MHYTQGIRPYALCVTLFNGFRRLILGAYCVVIGGIPAHNEGILDKQPDALIVVYNARTELFLYIRTFECT